jgi:hypothetical protein
MKKLTACYSIAVGILMLAQWTFFLAAGLTPEVKTAPIALGFHLAAEGATALTLIVAGMGLLKKAAWARTTAFTGLGMLLYTVIVSPGYFAQQGAWPLVGMFVILLGLALVSLRSLARNP